MQWLGPGGEGRRCQGTRQGSGAGGGRSLAQVPGEGPFRAPAEKGPSVPCCEVTSGDPVVVIIHAEARTVRGSC